MAGHREIRAVELENKTRRMDLLVLLAHDIGDGPQVLLMRVVILVRLECRDQAR